MSFTNSNMNLNVMIKLFALAFCLFGAIFLSLSSLNWFHEVLSIGLYGYSLILIVCLISLAVKNYLDDTLNYIFMLIGAVLNFTGGIMSIIYYSDAYIRYEYRAHKNMLIVGIFAILAGICMTADVIKTFFFV